MSILYRQVDYLTDCLSAIDTLVIREDGQLRALEDEADVSIKIV